MLTFHTSARLIRIPAIALLLLVVTIPMSLKTSAQGTSFVGDTLIPPHLFDLRADGVLHDFGFDSVSTILFIGRADGEGNSYDYVVRRYDYTMSADTIYENASPPSPVNFYSFDARGQTITLGFGFESTKHRYLVSSANAGQSWDTIDIGDKAYYNSLIIATPGTWLLKSGSSLGGWRYVTRDTAYWLIHKEWTDSHVQLFDDDSLLLFIADDGCGRDYRPDTGYFQFLQLGEVADNLMPVIVPAGTPAPLPPGSVCPLIKLIGSDGKRIWFKREWGISYHETQTNAFPMELYSYNLQTGAVQFEYFIRHPRWPVRAILFADHIFIAFDSQMVVRHVDDPPSTPFFAVPGVYAGLGALQVHDGALYGARSSGLVMRISQTTSVPTSDGGDSDSFTAAIYGEEIEVIPLNGATSGDVRLELFDAHGRRLAESGIAAGGSSGRLPTPTAPGVYFLRCGGSGIATTLRIIVLQH